MKHTQKPSALKGVLFAVTLFAGAAFCEVSYGSLTDTRDGKIYRTVRIDSQTWMAENLNYAYNKGTARSYCYEDDPVNCIRYGRLYTWAAAVDSAAAFGNDGKGCGYNAACFPAPIVRGVCPAGWHLPSDAEWDALKSPSDSGEDKLRNGLDAFGFGAFPSGYRDGDGRFNGLLVSENFWSTRNWDGSKDNWYLDRRVLKKQYSRGLGALSVRCVKD